MIFNITHTTAYEYSAPAVESFTELRVRPRRGPHQNVLQHVTEVNPRVPLEEFADYYGNTVECLSVPFRHRCLSVTSRSTVETFFPPDALTGLDLSVSEAVRLCWPERRQLFDFLMPSLHAPITPELEALSRRLLPSDAPFGESMLGLNAHIHREFAYVPGVTDVRTPISEVLESRQGVCQDFAHLMIALIRSPDCPARYVSGYIETYAPGDARALTGAAASHAWVEIYLPSGLWIGARPDQRHPRGRAARPDRRGARLPRRFAPARGLQGLGAPAALRGGDGSRARRANRWRPEPN